MAGTRPTTEKYEGFSDDERAAMKEHAKETKAAARRASSKAAAAAEGEQDVLAKIAEMVESDQVIAQRIHEIVKDVAPDLVPRTYYGMPAYAKDGKVLCFVKPAQKFKTRYTTFGFSDVANLDDTDMWPTEYAVTKLTPATEAKITELVRRAAS